MNLFSRFDFINETSVKDLFADPDEENTNINLHPSRENMEKYLLNSGYEDLAYSVKTGKDSIGQNVTQAKYNTWIEAFLEIQEENNR
jgi:hypothetical protein